MNNIYNKLSRTFLITLSIILLLITILLLFLGLVVEKKNRAYKAQLSGQTLIFSIQDENLISQNTSNNIIKQKKVQNAIKKQKSIPKTEQTPKKVEAIPAKTPVNDDHHDPINSVINDSISEPKTTSAAYDNRPSIVMIIGGLGLSKSVTNSAMKLPPSITLGFSPYSNDIDKLSYEAISKGHEILINLPLEPVDYPIDDPGPMGLISDLSDSKNIQRLKFILSLVENCQGVYSIEKEKFTKSPISTRNLLDELKKENKLFLYGVGGRNSLITQLAAKEGFDLFTNDQIIDEEISSDAILNKLLLLEEEAKANGMAIGIGNSYPITIEIIEKWAASLDNKGIQLVPLRWVAQKKVK